MLLELVDSNVENIENLKYNQNSIKTFVAKRGREIITK